jgi:hypothetical protein
VKITLETPPTAQKMKFNETQVGQSFVFACYLTAPCVRISPPYGCHTDDLWFAFVYEEHGRLNTGSHSKNCDDDVYPVEITLSYTRPVL